MMAALTLAFTAGVYAQKADTAVKAELGGNVVSMDVE
jgi:hypothetical protein